MHSALRRTFLVFALVIVGLPSIDSPSMALEVPPGSWQGSVAFDGELISDGVRGDGTDYHTVRSVESSTITFTATVAANGDVQGGAMNVDIRWHTDDTGTTPVTGDGYHVTSDHHEYGTLILGGGVDRLVAAGTLTSETQIFDTDGNYVEEASGARESDVSWIFSASSGVCALMSGTLELGEGSSLLNSATIPRGGDVPEYVNELVVAYHAWPADASGAEELADSLADLVDVIQQALAAESVSPDELALMVVALEALRSAAAKLEGCDLGIDLTTDTLEDVLAVLMNQLIARALEQADSFTAQELIKLLNIGVRSGAVAATGGITGAEALYDSFGEALLDALDDAVAARDTATIVDIAMAAAQYGFSDLYEEAISWYEDLG